MSYFHAMEIEFQKMHGTLNDFVVFHDLRGDMKVSPDQAAQLCNRRSGIGADGLIVIRTSDRADFFMDYLNADGSVAEMCGNGIRCLAKYVYDNGLASEKTLSVETRAGVKNLELFAGNDGKINKVQVDMGKPIFDAKDIPVLIEAGAVPISDYPIEAKGRRFPASILSMGNPHCVLFLDEDPGPFPALYGPDIQTLALFPAKTNVEFVQVLSRERLLMRVWERGSGETFSCGTGACASAVAARLKGFVDSQVRVDLLGGTLDISWEGLDYPVLMTGTVELVYNGRITI